MPADVAVAHAFTPPPACAAAFSRSWLTIRSSLQGCHASATQSPVRFTPRKPAIPSPPTVLPESKISVTPFLTLLVTFHPACRLVRPSTAESRTAPHAG